MSAVKGRQKCCAVGIAVLVLGFSGCGWPWPEVPSDDSLVQSRMDRDLDPDVSASQAGILAEGNAAFAFNLYSRVAKDDGNVIFSPFSLSLALAMTSAGARDATLTQMEAALQFRLPQIVLHKAFNAVDLALASRNELAAPYEGEGFELIIANSLWGQRGLPFLETFLDTLAANYGAGLRLADFSADPEEARFRINNWVSGMTRGKIEDLVPQGAVDKLTRLVLANAVYFRAPWLDPFDQQDTSSETFLPLSGAPISVPMMHKTLTARYANVDRVQAIELPYNGNQLAMLLLVPDAGTLTSFENALDDDTYRTIVTGLSTRPVYLAMPKFKFDHALSPTVLLQGLGMVDAFDPSLANFSGIDGARDLYISDVFHKAFIAVDEDGTEAAAATAVVIAPTSAPGSAVTLTVNRPFLFVIRDLPTDTILFLGRVVDPRG
ncbi:MAG: serpin family protein [Candidatus Bipolaricaulota bacterium]